MTYAAFRTSDKMWRSRPPANCRAARLAWDMLADDGPVATMRLVDGLWMCQREKDGHVADEVDATLIRQIMLDAE